MAIPAFVTERDTLENRKLVQSGLNYLLGLFRGIDETDTGPTTDSITCTITTGGGTVTLSDLGNKLSYMKLGRKVSIQGALVVESVDSPTGAVTINSLPFTSLTGTEFEGAFVVPVRMIQQTGSLTSTNGWVDGAIAAGADTISLLDGFVADLGVHIQATTIFYFSFTYFTD